MLVKRIAYQIRSRVLIIKGNYKGRVQPKQLFLETPSVSLYCNLHPEKIYHFLMLGRVSKTPRGGGPINLATFGSEYVTPPKIAAYQMYPPRKCNNGVDPP